ncbi:MAG: hypothetical protein M3O28_04215, partial [Actinomycetota bacterium]|nr:hypothetical protein [Actinomycetota bacterium]
PATCPAAACPVSASSSLTGDLRIILRSNPAYLSGEGATIVELTKAGLPVYWYSLPGELPSQLNCLYSPVRASCIVVDNVGAHGSKATLFRLDGSTLVKGAQVTSDSPQIQARDLNDDGWIDVEALQNTYQPDYATGAVYWQTWTSNGSELTSTGCTPATHTPPPAPLAPATGHCP